MVPSLLGSKLVSLYQQNSLTEAKGRVFLCYNYHKANIKCTESKKEEVACPEIIPNTKVFLLLPLQELNMFAVILFETVLDKMSLYERCSAGTSLPVLDFTVEEQK